MLLVDFRGVGGSSGNTTTVGVREAEDVAIAVNYTRSLDLKRPIVLYGVSMGTAAILKAVAQKKVNPDAIVLELPFTRLLDAVRSRLKARKIPTFPMAELVVFWGGVQHGFNGFVHNPVMDARQARCPVLLLYGKRDRWTTESEIDRIFNNFQGIKQKVVFPKAGHDLLVTADRKLWVQSIDRFLEQIENS